MLDIDRFKRLNDELGHAAGDAALRQVSAELTRVIRSRDTSYRYGGEEFLVIMPDTSLDAATAAAERIRMAIAELRIAAGAGSDAAHLTISGGVAFSLNARDHWEQVLAAADAALYRAKAAGRDHVCAAPAVVHERPAGRQPDRRGPAASEPAILPQRLERVDRAG
jgi:diguanylate cyclase (GGDEF)-like protein